MKDFTTYIIERANFIVKKHVSKNKLVHLYELYEQGYKQCVLLYKIDEEQFTNPDKEYSLEDVHCYILAKGNSRNDIEKIFPDFELDNLDKLKDEDSIKTAIKIVADNTNTKLKPSKLKKEWVLDYHRDLKRLAYDGDKPNSCGLIKYIDLSVGTLNESANFIVKKHVSKTFEAGTYTDEYLDYKWSGQCLGEKKAAEFIYNMIKYMIAVFGDASKESCIKMLEMHYKWYQLATNYDNETMAANRAKEDIKDFKRYLKNSKSTQTALNNYMGQGFLEYMQHVIKIEKAHGLNGNISHLIF